MDEQEVHKSDLMGTKKCIKAQRFSMLNEVTLVLGPTG